MTRMMIACVALACGMAITADLRAYPDQPVRVIVPFAPGGATDVIARIVAQKLSERAKQPFYVENLPGAAGRTGTNLVARAAPNGATILIVGSGFVVNPALAANLLYDPIKAFAPVTVIASSPNALVVHPSVPAATLQELAAYAQSQPGRLTFASPGAGTLPHLVGELFKQSFHLDITHVPFGGAAPAIASTLAGHTPIAVVPVPEAAAQVRAGALRALAVTAPRRTDVMAAVPTTREAGAPDLEAETIQAMLLPAGTSRAIIEQLHREIVEIVREPATAARLAELGFAPVASTPDEFAAFIAAEIAKWSKVVRAAGLQPQ